MSCFVQVSVCTDVFSVLFGILFKFEWFHCYLQFLVFEVRFISLKVLADSMECYFGKKISYAANNARIPPNGNKFRGLLAY